MEFTNSSIVITETTDSKVNPCKSQLLKYEFYRIQIEKQTPYETRKFNYSFYKDFELRNKSMS